MITVVAYLWFDAFSKHNDDYIYTSDDVRLLKRMVDRHLTVPHEFVCVTDQPASFNASDDIRTVPLDPRVRVPGRIFDKLLTFHPEAARIFGGSRILQMDLDCAVTGNMDALVNRDEDLVLWRNPARKPWHRPVGKAAGRAHYNTSMVLLTAGCRPHIWNTFEPQDRGGDQDWVSALVSDLEAYWDESDGVYRLAREDVPGSGIENELPPNARVVFFVGSNHKPWRDDIKAKHPWIAQHRH